MKTRKLYDENAYATQFEAEVLLSEKLGGEELEKWKKTVSAEVGDSDCVYKVVLNQTLFFPEEGGQTPDKGTLGSFIVYDVQIKEDMVTHYVSGELSVGSTVSGEIDWEHRFSNMQQHSGEHIFSGTVYKRFGYQNVGFHLSDNIVTMDFSESFSVEELEALEYAVNEAIAANVEITTGYPSAEELEAMEYRSKIDFTDGVRIVEIPGYDVCACCAPHVARTGEIGMFKILSAQNHRGGMRISFLCGFRALQEFRKKAGVIAELMGILTDSQENLVSNVAKLKDANQTLRYELAQAKQQLMEYKMNAISESEVHVLLFETELDTPIMRNIVNSLVEKHEGICGVFVGDEQSGFRFIIGSSKVDCKDVAQKLRDLFGAKGGGSTQMIQGSVENATEEALRQALLQ